jgi:predicted ATP-dependent endonuclease of OLD family
MRLTKIIIENYKSIKYLEFDIQKYGNSYTAMLLGINESGKSNILDAMSFLKKPEKEYDYYSLRNQKDEGNNDILLFYCFEVDKKNTFFDELNSEIEGWDLLNFEITSIIKNVYLRYGNTTFDELYAFDIQNFKEGLFVSKTENTVVNEVGQPVQVEVFKISVTKEDDTFEDLTLKKFKSYFSSKIEMIITKYEPSVAYWKPSPEYLISTDEDLNFFAQDINNKPALKNIFLLGGYIQEEAIQNIIATIANGTYRSRLEIKLERALNKYIKSIWNHNIDVVVDITETGKFTLSIKDTGEENEHDRLPIDGRSEGARHFLSLILSLSIESKYSKRKNQLILIDEPELHLHPSGIRDLSKELLQIGLNNYVFVSTHSPFLIDKKNKERHIIIKKNELALTEKIHIDDHTEVIDDEVLQEAFGLDVYKDLLNPHSLLVEGSSDKKIIQKALKVKGFKDYGITNGHGSNIDTTASKLNDLDIPLLVVVDDDKDGKKYRDKIIKIGGSYSVKNVFTIRDLVGDIVTEGTIEDTLGKEYVQARFKVLYEEAYTDECDIELTDDSSYIVQMERYVYKKKKADKAEVKKFIDKVKNELADKFKPSKGTFDSQFPLLNSLIDQIVKKLT